MITTFTELTDYLGQFVPGSIMNGDFYNPEKMLALLPIVGSPEKALKIIHVAGTSGKTSTCYYIAEMLKDAGAKVGLTISPHITEINERVQISGEPLSEKEMCELFSEFILIPNLVALKPTYFEIMVTFAFWAFAKMGCTHAVVEVGLGGLKDATNVVDDPEKVAVITDIGLDHTRILGDTLQKITMQKAGIIKPNNHVFCHSQSEIVDRIIDEHVETNQATLHRLSEDAEQQNTSFVTGLPSYQRRNWLLAKKVADYVIGRDSLSPLASEQLIQTQMLVIPARMQTIRVNGKTLVIDGAHNPQKLQALVSSLKVLYPNVSTSVLLSFGDAKANALEQNLTILKELTDNIVITEFSLREDLAHKSVSAEAVDEAAIILSFYTKIETDSRKALKYLLQQDSELLLITGSFYLIASLAEEIKNTQTM